MLILCHFGLWLVASLIFFLCAMSGIGGLFMGLGYCIGALWLWVIFPIGVGAIHLVLAFVLEGFFFKGIGLGLLYLSVPSLRAFILSYEQSKKKKVNPCLKD